MSNSNLIDISNKLFSLLLSIHSKAFNPDEFAKGHPIPPSHMKVIFYLKGHDSASLSEIAKKLSISKSNMTPIIDKLVNEDFVTRYEDPNDRRVLRVKLSEKSISLLEGIKNCIIEQFASKLSTLNEEDLSELSSSADNVRNILSKLK
ncbi:MarR family transcriptional regulator [uncultured Clostridium sp.]|uniref:MarR family winged helix-turn-helix transcriptional regulator n=1 Tax=uncultured Clostridium sp. TaxID=59620 RepID=UPI0025F4AC48|nr:MarR family transcriptional regulator [uncultured Clostridium sp.]